MDFVIEVVGDILEEVLSWLAESKRVPKAIQYVIFSVLHVGLLVFFVVLAFHAEMLWGRLLCGVLSGLSLVSWFFAVRKIKRR